MQVIGKGNSSRQPRARDITHKAVLLFDHRDRGARPCAMRYARGPLALSALSTLVSARARLLPAFILGGEVDWTALRSLKPTGRQRAAMASARAPRSCARPALDGRGRAVQEGGAQLGSLSCARRFFRCCDVSFLRFRFAPAPSAPLTAAAAEEVAAADRAAAADCTDSSSRARRDVKRQVKRLVKPRAAHSSSKAERARFGARAIAL
eukprot:scaffold57658_cov60-Phaeocystis_antarctica.AAC.1